ncbi:hypothetical protein J4206_05660, partial [Candidatus Woesearchaeota archaeon]|nr:hypothetical protein [Candidatus Woesearchaeota archaeon]
MKEKYLQFIASFLMVLVLTLPFYTTSVYAAINQASVKGSDGVEGFARANDFLNFNVQASLFNATVANSQVLLGSGTQFDRCTASANNSYECTLRFPGNGTAPFEAKSVPFTINLLKGDNTLDDSESSNITIDDKAPQVELTSQSTFSSQQNVVINYDVTDFACDDPSCSGKCVGIKKIKFYTNDSALQQEINPTTSSCSIKSSISIDPKTFNNGQNSVFAKATDKFDKVSAETSVTFNVDAASPKIIQDSFTISNFGIRIDSFSLNSAPAVVNINISGSDLDLNSVTADLSALNPSANLKNVKASCAFVDDGLSICKWLIGLNPKTPGLKTIVINASDTLGNKESATINKQLALDDKGPVVQSLSTSETAAQILAKSSGNTVIAVFDEATGLSPNQIFLHIDDIKAAATSCAKDATWACIWNNVNFGSSKSKISIEPDTTDILGNAVSETFSADVVIDNKPPVLKSMNISPVGGLAQAFQGFPKIGDKIFVVASLTEDNDVSAVADFSKFISGASKAAGSCQRAQADEHTCTWDADANTINLQSNDLITFNFSDNAGNTLIVTKSFKTYGLENATVPDFWTSTVQCSPSTIDRQLGPLINQRVFCQASLTQKSTTKPASTVFIGPAACSGSSIVQSVDTLNTGAGSTSPIVKITFNKDDFRVDSANLTCSFSIYSKIGSGTTITQNPEIENVNIPVQFSNLPIGELSSDVQRKIDDAKDEAEGIYKTIGTLNKVMNVAKKICQLLHTIYNIVSVLYFVAHALNLADIAAQ